MIRNSWLIVLALGVAAAARGADAVWFFIPQQRADQALTAFAQQADVALIFPFDEISQVTANQLIGEYEIEEGLKILLEGTGLTTELKSRGQVIVQVPDIESGRATSESEIAEGNSGILRTGSVAEVAASIDEDVASAPHQAEAQPGAGRRTLNEIFVTAQKREQDLQDVPISVHAVSGQFIQEFSVERLDDLSQYIPNLSIYQTYVGERIGIRGVATGAGQNFEQSVGTFVDGVYFGRSKQSTTAFLDVERIEVLRGPQVTYFGNNAIAGALNIQTRRPGPQWNGYVQSTLAQHNETTVEAAYGGPVADTLGIRGAVKYRDMGGFMKNSLRGADEASYETGAARISFLWEPRHELSIYAKLEDSTTDQVGTLRQISQCPIPGHIQPPELENSGPTGWCVQANSDLGTVFEGDYTRESGAIATRMPATVPIPFEMTDPEHHFQNAQNANVTTDYLMGDYTLTSVTGYTKYDTDGRADVDGTPWAQMHSLRTERFEQLSQEVRITSPIGGKLAWLAGLYWQSNDLDLTVANDNFFAGGFGEFRLIAGQKEKTSSGFTGLTFNTSNELRFNLGGRYSKVDKRVPYKTLDYRAIAGVTLAQVEEQFDFGFGPHTLADYPAGSDTYDTDSFDFSIGLQWDTSANTMLYATYTEGFKAGGFDLVDRNPALGDFQFGEEGVKAVEAGLRGTYLDNRLRLNVSLFYNDYTDLQVNTFDTITLIFFTQNAAGSRSQGLEFDTQWAPTDNILLTMAGAILDAEYTDWAYGCTIYQQLVEGLGSTDCQAAGEPLGTAPDRSLSVGVRHATLVGGAHELRVSGNLVYESTQRLNDSPGDPRMTIGATTIADLRIAFGDTAGRWEVAVFVKNLTDEFKPLSMGDVPVQSGAIEIDPIARPRYYGISGQFNFGP